MISFSRQVDPNRLGSRSLEAAAKLVDKSRVMMHRPMILAHALRLERATPSGGDKSKRADLRTKAQSKAERTVAGAYTSSDSYRKSLWNSAIPSEQYDELVQLNRNGAVEWAIAARIVRRLEAGERRMNKLHDSSSRAQLRAQVEDLLTRHRSLLAGVIGEVIAIASLETILGKRVRYSTRVVARNTDIRDLATTLANLGGRLKGNVSAIGAAAAADGGIDGWSRMGWSLQVKNVALTVAECQVMHARLGCPPLLIVCSSRRGSGFSTNQDDFIVQTFDQLLELALSAASHRILRDEIWKRWKATRVPTRIQNIRAFAIDST